MEPELEQLPEALQTLADISMAIPDSYLIASGIMHVFGTSTHFPPPNRSSKRHPVFGSELMPRPQHVSQSG
jgi:hypothetical protein